MARAQMRSNASPTKAIMVRPVSDDPAGAATRLPTRTFGPPISRTGVGPAEPRPRCPWAAPPFSRHGSYVAPFDRQRFAERSDLLGDRAATRFDLLELDRLGRRT